MIASVCMTLCSYVFQCSYACMLTRLILLYILNTEPDYPQNYLIINDSGVHLAGVDAEFNHALPEIARPPVAVDTINRFVYWYHESPKSIARHSLNSGSMDIHVCLTLDNVTVKNFFLEYFCGYHYFKS